MKFKVILSADDAVRLKPCKNKYWARHEKAKAKAFDSNSSLICSNLFKKQA